MLSKKEIAAADAIKADAECEKAMKEHLSARELYEVFIGVSLCERLRALVGDEDIERCFETADLYDTETLSKTAPMVAAALLANYTDFVLDGGTEYVSNGE